MDSLLKIFVSAYEPDFKTGLTSLFWVTPRCEESWIGFILLGQFRLLGCNLHRLRIVCYAPAMQHWFEDAFALVQMLAKDFDADKAIFFPLATKNPKSAKISLINS